MPKILSDRDKVMKCKYGIHERDKDNIVVTQSCINSLNENKKERWQEGEVECKVQKPEDCDSFKLIKSKK